MNLSVLLARYGDDRLQFQKLDDCTTNLQMTKQGTKATFGTAETFDLNGFHKLGLIVWLDRDKVREIIANPTSPTPDHAGETEK